MLRNPTRPHRAATALILPTVLLAQAVPAPELAAQTPSTDSIPRLTVEPTSATIEIGESFNLTVNVIDGDGETTTSFPPLILPSARDALSIDGMEVTGLRVGEHAIYVTTAEYTIYAADFLRDTGEGHVVEVPVTVTLPPVVSVEVRPELETVIVGHTVPHEADAFHEREIIRTDVTAVWVSSNPEIATVDPFGNVRGFGIGEATITATVAGVSGSVTHEVGASPAASLAIEGGAREVRTGDVQNFTVLALTTEGRPVPEVPVSWAYAYQPDDSVRAPAGTAQIEHGRMVADVPGLFTAIATSGNLRTEYSFRVVSRNAVRKLEVIGQGRESRVFTTDIWVWEGLDGRDYAMTGSKMGDGVTFVWDVTDPAGIFMTDSVMIDARTTNDVKVSPDGRYSAISREGASNRRNGVVILDLADPAHPRIASTYDEGLTGGVHNMFATDTHLFALSGGDKYVILDMSDLGAPRYVSEYNHPDSRVHDVWVHDGLAYSAEWRTGVVVVDVGNGRWGGSIEEPRLVTTFSTTTGSTHAVFPYYQESTGRFLLIVGDERVQRRGFAWEGTGPDHRTRYDPETGKGGYPRATSGYTQIFDFTDPENPVQLARYEVSEYGTHNMWVEDDILYQAYYEGGVRMVDISGDLMGNLYTQGREIAVMKAHDPLGYIPNSPAAWSVMPWKGNILFSDINSGVWAVRLRPVTPIS